MIRNWTKVFSFTFRMHVQARGYRVSTVVLALLLLLAIPGTLLFLDSQSSAAARETGITLAAHADGLDYAPLSGMLPEIYKGIDYRSAGSLEEARALCAGETGAVIVAVDGGMISVILPEDSEVSPSDAEAFGEYLAAVYPFLLSPGEAAQPAYAAHAAMTDPADMAEAARGVFSMVLPYVVMMIMYFMMLIYGQGVANGVIMEKTSRLMDLFLATVKPAAMILGKTLAIALAGILQTCIWLGAAAGGFSLGVWLVKLVNPGASLGIISFFDMLGSMAGLFTPAGFAVAIALIVAGFLLYCALASIGGAMAGKPEDLSTTNLFFTIALVASFFACMFTGENAGMVSQNPLLNYIPFTAILVAPSRVLLGEMSIAQGLISLGIVLGFALALALLAGKVYSMTAFYKGNPPTPVKMLKLLRRKHHRDAA